MTEGVKNFLSRLGLDQYHEMFTAKGFDLESDICHLNEEDLNSMYISDGGDRHKLLQAAIGFKPSREHVLLEWLRERGLDHYYISFVQSELVDLTVISRLNLPDAELYDELEIMLPGHRRRLERAVHQLSKKHRTVLPSFSSTTDVLGPASLSHQTSQGSIGPEPESPVAYGRWGKPRCLSDAKYDFLLLDATLVSTNDPGDKVDMEFMVDSGSDVVTIRQEVLDSMDLELIGRIHSKGVHASRTKNLYRANLRVGNHVLEIEVMGESYDSIGSRVIRHFRHFINGSRHVWLKGDYADSEMSPKSSQMTSSQDSCTTTSSSSQDKHLEHSVPSPRESVPSLSQEHSQHSEQPEEQGDETSAAEVAEQTEHISQDVNPSVQNDCVKSDKLNHIELAQSDIISSKETKDVDFNFVKGSFPIESDLKYDETDKIMCTNDDVIDIRPIINANRKRHASNDTGFEPKCGDAEVTKIRRKNKRAIQDNLNSLRTIKVNNNEYRSNNHVTGVENEADKFETVMGQRSVYYRSQVKTQSSAET